MVNLIEVHALLRAAASDAMVAAFATRLGVAPRALRALECGIAGREEMRRLGVGFSNAAPNVTLVIPERGADGMLTGFCFRDPDGIKGAMVGTHRGLTYSTRPNKPDPVFLVEGGSDVAAAETLAISSLGRPSNATGIELLAAFPGFEKREVYVLADNDKPGTDGATQTAQELANRWKRAVPWTTLPPGAKDLRAYLVSLGLDLNDEPACADAGARLVVELRERAKLVRPVTLTRCFADIEPRDVEWLLYPVVPLGKITMISGDPGLGKSLVSIDMGARLSRGEGLSGERPPTEPGEVLLLSAEDDAHDTVRPRLDAARAIVDRAHTAETLDLHDLKKLLDERTRVRLVVVDPMTAFEGDIDAHRDSEVRSYLAPFAELAAQRRIAIVFVNHLRKSADGPAIYRPGGSIAHVAAARSAWIAMRDPADKHRRLFLPLKNNLGPDTSGWAYRVVAETPGGTPHVEWEPDRITESADTIAARGKAKSERAGRGEALEEASGFLREFLADGPKLVADVLDAGRANAIGRPSLKRAKAKLGVIAEKATGKFDGGWIWRLPPDGAEGSKPAEGDHVSPRDRHEPLREERDDDGGSSFDVG